MLLFCVNLGYSQNKSANDSVLNNVLHKIDILKTEINEVKEWRTAQKELTDLTNQRISDNLSQTDRLSTFTTFGISLFAFIVTVMNVILFIWIFSVQRNLKEETKEINAETKKSSKELGEKLNKKSEELSRKTEELYKKMLDSKYGQYDKKLRDEITHEDESKEFDQLESFSKKILRAEKELDENNLRAAINHFSILLAENTERDYVFNRLGIAYYKMGASEKALDYFLKAYNETEKNKKKYVMNLLSQYLIVGKVSEASDLIEKCETFKIDNVSLCVFFTLKFIFYVKTNNKQKLSLLKKQQAKVDWNKDSNWEFNNFKDCFKEEFVNDFSDIFRFANILYNKEF
jgi:tetratricopeptide (TPR) repeat protein